MPAPILPLLQRLSAPSASATDFEAAVTALVERSQTKAQPLMAAAATLRHHRSAAGLDRVLVARLMERMERELKARRPAPAIEVPDLAEYVGEERAAAILGLRPADLRAQLIDHRMRRQYGFPHWDGVEFRFSLAALRPATRQAVLATLSEIEPLQELLPEWCRRA